MKDFRKLLVLSLLLSAFVAMSGSEVLASAHPNFRANFGELQLLKAKSQAPQLFFEDIDFGTSPEVLNDKNFNSSGILPWAFQHSFRPYLPLKKATSVGDISDKRRELQHKIFPFHFFW
ncbi:MAG: hypothetical protein WCE57_08670 [Salegentibacter sp.]